MHREMSCMTSFMSVKGIHRMIIGKCFMLTELQDAFRIFDKDNSGSITKDELGTVLRNLGQFPSMDELDEMLNEVDIDGERA